MTRRWIATLAVALTAPLFAAESASATAQACCIPWQQPGQIVVSPDSKFAYASDYQVAIAVAVDQATGQLTLINSYDTRASVAAMPPDGRHVYFADSRGTWFTRFARDASSGALTQIGDHSAIPGVPGYIADMASSPDGLQLYAADDTTASVLILDRDPESGAVGLRGKIELPVANGERHNRFKILELSPDGKFLYAKLRGEPSQIVTLSRSDDGGLAVVGSVECAWCAYFDLAIAPDGRHLFDESGPLTFDRDPATGSLTNPRDNPSTPRSGAKSDAHAGAMAVSPDGKSLYTIDEGDGKLFASTIGPDGSLTHQATYREAVDGAEGLRLIKSVTVSPAGDFVFVASGAIDPGKLGRFAAFRRDPATGLLTFADVIDGPDPRRDPGPGGPVSPTLTINDGAEYTKDPDVTVKFGGLGGRTIPFVTLSNDGGFGASENRWATTDHVYQWKLASSGPERLPKTVYGRLAAPFAGVATDDIILDERDPTVQYVEAPKAAKKPGKKVRLKVRARDTLSGVAAIQTTTNKKKSGEWKKFTSRPVVRTSRKATWVRVKDRAGNTSRWQKAKVKR